jgi:osmotically-inducible protein OsmY
MDERDRSNRDRPNRGGPDRDRDWRRSEAYGQDQRREYGRDYRGASMSEGRSFGGGDFDDDYYLDRSYDRNRTGGSSYGSTYGASFGGERDYGSADRTSSVSRGGWQDRDYEGTSPAFRNQDQGAVHGRAWQDRSYGGPSRAFRSQDYTGGARAGDYGRNDRYESGYRAYGRGDDDRRREAYDEQGGGASDFLYRAGRRISNWFRGDDLMDDRSDRSDRSERYAQDRGHRGTGPKGYKRSDERINDEVHDRLTDDQWLDATNIQVQVSNGEVTLSGTVDNRESKHRAERLVEDLSGVTHVQNNLRVASNPITGSGTGLGDAATEASMRRDEDSLGTGATTNRKPI